MFVVIDQALEVYRAELRIQLSQDKEKYQGEATIRATRMEGMVRALGLTPSEISDETTKILIELGRKPEGLPFVHQG